MISSSRDPSIAQIRLAADRIVRHVVRTPLERSDALSKVCGIEVWLKLECFQATGSFKLRGALNALAARPAARHVVTASAGNHGLGLARAAVLLGRSATVVVPETASSAKVEALRHSGAELVQVGQTYDEAETYALSLARDRAIPYISPYNDLDVIAGGGTITLEIFEDLPDTKTLLVPVGGGGLISGVALACGGVAAGASVVGIQSQASPAMRAALDHGAVYPVELKATLADGLAGNLERGTLTLGLVQRYVREVVLVSEQAIADAMGWLLLNERVVAEGSAAVGVAALLEQRLSGLDGPVVVVLTGRNVAAPVLRKVASEWSPKML